MSLFLSIQALHEEGLGNKAIARRLDVDVRTVRKYVRRIAAGAREPVRAPVSRKLEPFDATIRFKVEQGLSAIQIYPDLCAERDLQASYETVKRRVRALRRTEPVVYCRQRFAPGDEAQIDFGEVGRLQVGGQSRRLYLFVLTLCWSRMAYYELVLDQRVVTFLGAIRRAFEFLGGAPARLKPDNLRAAVLFDQLGQRYSPPSGSARVPRPLGIMRCGLGDLRSWPAEGNPPGPTGRLTSPPQNQGDHVS